MAVDKVSVQIKGIDVLNKTLDGINSSLIPAVKKGVNLGLAVVEGTSKMLCPTNKYSHGGGLREKIHIRPAKVSGRVVQGAVYAASDHAVYVEFGTGVIGEASHHPAAAKLDFTYAHYSWVYTPDNGKNFYRTNGMVARPFLYPGLVRNRSNICKLLADSVSGIGVNK